MPITHTVPAGLPTGTVAGKVAGDDWRASHNSPPFALNLGQVSGNTLTNMTAALTVIGTQVRAKVDLTYVTQARLSVGILTAGSVNAEFRIQYATDGDTQAAWAYLDNVSGPLANISGVGARTGAWVNLVAGAKADVVIRPIAINGDGVADPVYGSIVVQFR